MTPQWIGIDYVFRAVDERRWAELDLRELRIEITGELASKLTEGQLARRRENAARRRTAKIAAGTWTPSTSR